MQRYTWHGRGAIHTPSGVVDPGGTFTSGDHWLSHHPQRQWLKRGLITVFVEPAPAPAPAPKPEKK